jgi:nucleotide-binding universal stress UspA family protein
MFSHILVPLDGTAEAEIALAHASALAHACDARVTCLHVLDISNSFDKLRPAPADPLALQLRRAEMTGYMNQVAGRLTAGGIHSETQIVEGFVAESILDYCCHHSVDLVTVTHRERGREMPASSHPFSVSLAVAHSACTSLLLLSETSGVSDEWTNLAYRRVIAPLDGSQRAECVLPVVGILATACGSEVLLAHVVQPPEMPRRTPLSQHDAQLSVQIVARNRAEAELYLDSLRPRLPAGARSTVVIGDHVVSKLHEMIEQADADLIVISAHGYSAQTQWPFGSVAGSFIEHCRRPLLMIQDAPTRKLVVAQEAMAGRMPAETAPASGVLEQR